MTADRPVVPPASIGMLGGGQLGRYALIAARLMGYGTVVLDPDPAAPAGAVADEHVVAAYTDEAALAQMARRCAAVSTEFENPPAAALERLARDTIVAPSAAAVAVAQDRLAEKRFLSASRFPVVPFAEIDVRMTDLIEWEEPRRRRNSFNQRILERFGRKVLLRIV